ncbi:MAG: AfsR/SARP family transcriptional regulator [Acidimicrobiales bacterium]
MDDDGRGLDLGRPKQRALLALLLIHAGSVVSTDKLADDLWAGEPPDDPGAALQVQVSRLRKVLGAGAVESRRPGYCLAVAGNELDAVRFERLVSETPRRPRRSPCSTGPWPCGGGRRWPSSPTSPGPVPRPPASRSSAIWLQ